MPVNAETYMDTICAAHEPVSPRLNPATNALAIGGYVTIHRGRVVAFAACSQACAREARASLPEQVCDAPIPATAAVIRALLCNEALESFYVSDGLCRTFKERRTLLSHAWC